MRSPRGQAPLDAIAAVGGRCRAGDRQQ